MESASGLSGFKRGNDDFDEPSKDSIHNGAKKGRYERFTNEVISKVVHFRNLPDDVGETEVINIGINYGTITNILMLKGKNQAFLEMENEDVAKQIVDDCANKPPIIRQRTTYVQYSTHHELKTDNSPGQMKAQAILQAMQHTDGGPDHVLRIVIDNMHYPITLDVLHTIFSKFGVVLKTITFNKNNQFQALIQMGDADQARTAKRSLDGQNIYNGCCTLRIDYSNMHSLKVKYNTDKSRDYMRDDLPSGDNCLLSTPSSSLQSLLASPASLLSNPLQAQAATLLAALQQSQVSLSSGLSDVPKRPSYAERMRRASRSAQISSFPSHPPGYGSVLHVSNLDEDKVTPNILFTLFGVYGDVLRVKILFQKKSNALVQMYDDQHAQVAMRYLDGVKLFGRSIHISSSKHNQVQMPKEGLDEANLTQDFSGSNLHRFKKPGSKNYQNIFPPSDVLHLSNIPADTTEEFLVDRFSEHGQVKEFKFFQKDRRMALIQMSSLNEAVTCLVMIHNLQLSDTNHLRVSFSKGHI